MQLLVATRNRHKLKELRDLLTELNLDVISSADVPGLQEVVEDAETLRDNAIKKAVETARFAKKLTLADDTGLEVVALNGEPGIRSARFAGEPKSDQRNNEKLIELLQGHANRKAHYYCVMVLVRWPEDPQPIIAEGAMYGEIIDTPRGDGGFGYDPYFLIPEFGQTGAEIPMDVKNRISHRGKALAVLVEKLRASL